MVELADVNGTQIAYTLDGPEAAPVLTMSHSLSADHSMWDPQMPALSDAYRVLRFDTRGHGASAVPTGAYTLDQLADDVIGLWNHLGIAQTHYCGLSMGGMIGQTLALKVPERLRTLVLCDTASSYPPEAQAMWADRIAAAKTNGLEAGIDGTIDRWFSPGFVSRAPDVIAGVRRMIAATPVDGYCGCGAAIARLSLTDRLGEIKIPTLVICGEDDPGTPLAMSEVIRDGIAGAELVVLPEARHLSNMEDVAGFNAALRGFLDRH